MFKTLVIYENLDEMPIDNFRKVLETGDVRASVGFVNILGQSTKGTIRKSKHKAINKGWVNVYDEYLRVFGLNKRHEAILIQEEKIAKLKIRRWTTGKRSLDALITIEEKRLLEMQPKKTISKRNFAEDLAIVQKYSGYPMPANITSAMMFFTHVKMMEKAAADIKNKNNARANRR